MLDRDVDDLPVALETLMGRVEPAGWAQHFNKQLPLSLDGISGYLSPQLMHNHGAT